MIERLKRPASRAQADSNGKGLDASEGETATRWRVVGIAMLVAVIAAGHIGKLPPALPSIRIDLGLDIVSAGWLASTFSTVGMLSAIAFGVVASRLNPWHVAVAGLALLAVSGTGGAFAVSAWQLLISRFLEGLGFLSVIVAAPTLIASASAGRERGLALGIFSGYVPVGVSLMIFTAPAALSVGGWRFLWLVVASLAILAALGMFLIGRTQRAPAKIDPLPWNAIRQTFAQRGPWLVATCFALYGSQLYAIITWMPTFMVEIRGIDSANASVLTALIVVANGSFSFIGGWFLHRGAVSWAIITVAAGVMGIAAGAAFFLPMPDVMQYVAIATLCGAGGLVAAASFASAPMFADTPRQTGLINGLIVQASNLAQFVGPSALAATVAHFGSWESALGLMASTNAAIVAIALYLRKMGRAF